MKMVNILEDHIAPEHAGDWELQLSILELMI